LRPARQAGELPGRGFAVDRQPPRQPARAHRLYLPKSWAEDWKHRRKAGVPDEIAFQTKPKIALDQLAWALVGFLAASC
jgi:hypothetical protein